MAHKKAKTIVVLIRHPQIPAHMELKALRENGETVKLVLTDGRIQMTICHEVDGLFCSKAPSADFIDGKLVIPTNSDLQAVVNKWSYRSVQTLEEWVLSMRMRDDLTDFARQCFKMISNFIGM